MKRLLDADAAAHVRADFPGRHAGASLKHPRARARARGPHPDFPGRHAGASLKPEGIWQDSRASPGISPADTPGPH